MKALTKANLFCKLSKCEFFASEIELLGYSIKPGGFAIAPSKVEAVFNWPVPTSCTKLRGFLALANFCCKFIKDFSVIALPLTALTSSKAPFVWSTLAQEAFDTLKYAFTLALVLLRPDPDCQFFLETDASNYTLGVVLLQQGEDGEFHPLTFYLYKLLNWEHNYHMYEKELYAIVNSLKYWRRYLEGSKYPTIICTDHKNLLYFTEKQKIVPCLARWAIDLLAYDFVIEYTPGKLNIVSDAISRQEDLKDNPAADLDHNNRAVLSSSQFLSSIIEISAFTALDQEIMEAQMVFSFQEELTSMLKRTPKAVMVNNQGISNVNGSLVIPEDNLQTQAVSHMHEGQLVGHGGLMKTLKRLSRQYWCSGMKKDVRDFIFSCVTCGRNKPGNSKPQGLLRPLPIPTQPWSSISMDFIVDLPVSSRNSGVMVVVDCFTKYAIFILFSSCNAKEVASMFFERVVCNHSLPTNITSDRGFNLHPVFGRLLWRKWTLRSTYPPPFIHRLITNQVSQSGSAGISLALQ